MATSSRLKMSNEPFPSFSNHSDHHYFSSQHFHIFPNRIGSLEEIFGDLTPDDHHIPSCISFNGTEIPAPFQFKGSNVLESLRYSK